MVQNDPTYTQATLTPDQIAANLYEAPVTTSFGGVGLFNQFVSIQRNAFLQSLKNDRFTNVPEETPSEEPATNLHR